MGIIDGGTERDLARAEVDICFTFEPRGTERTIEQIFEKRHTTNPNLRILMQEEADDMVKRRHLLVEGRKVYVFSKDSQGKYSWQSASRIRDYLRGYFN